MHLREIHRAPHDLVSWLLVLGGIGGILILVFVLWFWWRDRVHAKKPPKKKSLQRKQRKM
jgi:hypothetical protein